MLVDSIYLVALSFRQERKPGGVGVGGLSSSVLNQAASGIKPNLRQLNEDLEAASQSGNLELVRYLIEMGATDISKALITAVTRNKVNVVRYLIGLGHVNLNDLIREIGRYRSVKPETIQELIDAGATNADEAMSMAIQQGYFDLIKGLLDLGVRPKTSSYPRNAEFGRYQNPEVKLLSEALLRAFEENELSILAFISVSGAKDIDEALIKAAQADRLDVVQFLLHNGALTGKRNADIVRLINQAIAAAANQGTMDPRLLISLLRLITGTTDLTQEQLQDYVTLAKYMSATGNVVLSLALDDAARDGRLDIVKILVRTPVTKDDIESARGQAIRSDQDNIVEYLYSILEGETKLDYRLPYLKV
jgi:ankyrin repeat protein